MSLSHKSQELRAIEKQVEELRVLNFKLNEQLKEISKTKKTKSLSTKMAEKMSEKISYKTSALKPETSKPSE